MAERVEIFEVGPRDGLQNEKRAIPTAEKVALIDCLSDAGFARIEAASFVAPKWVPQMADSAQVMAGITRRPGVKYTALAPNMRGYRAALEAEVDEIAIFASASEGFSQANLNASIAESLARFAEIAAAAKADGMPMRGYVSCVADCPYDGAVPPENVARVAVALRDLGAYEISLGDTLGHGSPDQISAMLSVVVGDIPAKMLAGHYHDTGGQALANVEVSLTHGLRVFDAAVGGLGGCPYAPSATGNVATEALLARLTALGFETGLDAQVVEKAARLAQSMRG